MYVCVPVQKALQEFVLRQNRSAELHTLPDQVYILDENAFFNDMRLGRKERKRLNITTTLKKSLSFSLPGTKLSVDFFKDQVGQTVCVCVCLRDMFSVAQISSCYYTCGCDDFLRNNSLLAVSISTVSMAFLTSHSCLHSISK